MPRLPLLLAALLCLCGCDPQRPPVEVLRAAAAYLGDHQQPGGNSEVLSVWANYRADLLGPAGGNALEVHARVYGEETVSMLRAGCLLAQPAAPVEHVQALAGMVSWLAPVRVGQAVGTLGAVGPGDAGVGIGLWAIVLAGEERYGLRVEDVAGYAIWTGTGRVRFGGPVTAPGYATDGQPGYTGTVTLGGLRLRFAGGLLVEVDDGN